MGFKNEKHFYERVIFYNEGVRVCVFFCVFFNYLFYFLNIYEKMNEIFANKVGNILGEKRKSEEKVRMGSEK